MFRHIPPERMFEKKEQRTNEQIIDSIFINLQLNKEDVVLESVIDGFVHYVYKITDKKSDIIYFIKIRRNHFHSNQSIQIEPEDIGIEYKSIKLVSQLLPGIAPPIVYFNEADSVICMEDIRGQMPTVAEILYNHQIEYYEKIGQEIGQLHSSLQKISTPIREGGFEQVFYNNNLYYRLGFLGIPEVDIIIAQLARLPKQVIHGDLNPKNLVFDTKASKLKIYDWETMHLGNQIFDLAFFEAHLVLEHCNEPEKLKSIISIFKDGYEGFVELSGKSLEIPLIFALILYRLKSGFNYPTKHAIDKKHLIGVSLEIIKDKSLWFWPRVYGILDDTYGNHSDSGVQRS